MVDSADITRAADVLRGGGVVAFPTETVYGLGANAFDENAVARVFEIKARPRFDPLIVHVEDADRARQLVASFPRAAERLAEAFWPGPLTIVLPKHGRVADLVTAGLATVAVRVPGHEVARAMIEQAATAVAAPSANRFGGVSPTTAEHVRADLGDAADLVLDGGPCDTGIESTVVSLVAEPTVLRLGGVAVERIEGVIGKVAIAKQDSAIEAPGMLEKHYAPRTPMRVVATIDIDAEAQRGGRVGLLLFLARPTEALESFAAVEVLSPRGDVREAAANLFGALRRLDGAGVDRIIAERVPDEGLGRAINDRLRRGCH